MKKKLAILWLMLLALASQFKPVKWFKRNYPFFILAAIVLFIIWWLAGVTLS